MAVTARYWQPDDSHCVSREYLETAAWSADSTVQVRSGFTLEQVRAVRAALGPSTATVRAPAGRDLAAWEHTLANPLRCDTVPAAAAWLRTHLDGDAPSSVSVGTATTWTKYVSDTGSSPVSERTVETAARVTAAHPDARSFSVSGSLVTAVVPTERQAEAVVAAFGATPADADGQRVSLW